MKRSSSLAFLLLVASLAPADEVDDRLVGLHTSFLSASELGDVSAGSRGYEISLRYIVTEMERLGYAAAGRGGDWFFEHTLLDMRPAGVTRLVSSVGDALPREVFSPLLLSGEGALSGGLKLLGPGEPIPGSAEGSVLLVVREAGETPEEAAARAAVASPGAILITDRPGLSRVDVVRLTDGGVLEGRAVDRGREFLVRESRTGRIFRLTPQEVAEIRFDVRGDRSGDWAWRPMPTQSMSMPVLGLSRAGVESMAGCKLAVLLRDGVPEGLRLRVNVVIERRMREVREVRAAWRPSTGPVVTIRVAVDLGRKGVAAAAALGVAASLAAREDSPGRFRFVFGSRELLEETPWTIQVDGETGPVEAAAGALRQTTRALEKLPSSGLGPAPPELPSYLPKLEEVRAARLRGEIEKAVWMMKLLRLAYSSGDRILLESGRVRLAAGDYEGALADAGKLEESEGGRSFGRLLRAEVHYARGDTELGDAALNLACDGDLPEALFRRALRRTVAGDPPEAVRGDLRSAFEKAGDNALGDCARGLLLLSLGHLEPAEEMLSKALAKDALMGLAYRYRAEVRAALEREPVEVARDCDAALSLGVDDASLRFTRGLARLRSGFFPLAIRDFERCIVAGVDPANATYNIACAHALAGRTEEALDWLARSLEAGFRDFEHARSDPDLASLTNDPRFEGILRSRRAE